MDADFDTMIDDAEQQAVDAITSAQGAPYDPTDAEQVGALLLEAPKQLPCFTGGRATKDYGPPIPETAPVAAAVTVGRPQCTNTGCMAPFNDTGRKYCGAGSARRGPWISVGDALSRIKNVRCNACLNAACHFHDGCGGDYCTSLQCMFTNPPSIHDPDPTSGDVCTQCFFKKLYDCVLTAQQEGNFDDAACIRNVQNVAHTLGVLYWSRGNCNDYAHRTYCPEPFPASGYCQCKSFCLGCGILGDQLAASGICCPAQQEDFCVPFPNTCGPGRSCNSATHTCVPYPVCPDVACEPRCDKSDEFHL